MFSQACCVPSTVLITKKKDLRGFPRRVMGSSQILLSIGAGLCEGSAKRRYQDLGFVELTEQWQPSFSLPHPTLDSPTPLFTA